MKRFLKKKIVDTANDTIQEPLGGIQPVPSPSTVFEKKEVKPVIQPPLPLYPPPPDSPPKEITIKKEMEDDYVTDTDDNSTLNVYPIRNEPPDSEPVSAAEADKPRICKDFIRGTCVRKACKYAHEIDLKQLEGIFTFCWNYQNSICVKPNCKYVHADSFEEGEFYRTGVLPPHVLNHLQAPKVNILPPPPPPPEEPPQNVPSVFTNPPPPLYTPVVDQPMAMAVQQAPMVSETERVIAEGYRLPHMQSRSNAEDVTSALKPLDDSGDEAKCKSCVDMEFRLQYNKSKVDKMVISNKEINDKISQLDKKMQKLYSILVTLLKPGEQANSALSSLLKQ